ncbi:MAG: hypothetical protein V2I33_24315 [Kangiellaceae bacterium]|nr:hypothetical protein [Kangiellaceae bacterium]
MGEQSQLPLTDVQNEIDDILNSTWKPFLLILNIILQNIVDETLL